MVSLDLHFLKSSQIISSQCVSFFSVLVLLLPLVKMSVNKSRNVWWPLQHPPITNFQYFEVKCKAYVASTPLISTVNYLQFPFSKHDSRLIKLLIRSVRSDIFSNRKVTTAPPRSKMIDCNLQIVSLACLQTSPEGHCFPTRST